MQNILYYSSISIHIFQFISRIMFAQSQSSACRIFLKLHTQLLSIEQRTPPRQPSSAFFSGDFSIYMRAERALGKDQSNSFQFIASTVCACAPKRADQLGPGARCCHMNKYMSEQCVRSRYTRGRLEAGELTSERGETRESTGWTPPHSSAIVSFVFVTHRMLDQRLSGFLCCVAKTMLCCCCSRNFLRHSTDNTSECVCVHVNSRAIASNGACA